MRPSLAVALLQFAAMPVVPPPLPPGFMWLFVQGITINVPCLADDCVPPDGRLYVIEPYNDGRAVALAHPQSWAEMGARCLAAAYRPEGL